MKKHLYGLAIGLTALTLVSLLSCYAITPPATTYIQYPDTYGYSFNYPSTFQDLRNTELGKGLSTKYPPEIVLGEYLGDGSAFIACRSYPNPNGSYTFPTPTQESGTILINSPQMRVHCNDERNIQHKAYFIITFTPEKVYTFMIDGDGKSSYTKIDEVYQEFMQSLTIVPPESPSPTSTIPGQLPEPQTSYIQYPDTYGYTFSYPSTFIDLRGSELETMLSAPIAGENLPNVTWNLILGEWIDKYRTIYIASYYYANFAPDSKRIEDVMNYNYLLHHGFQAVPTTLPQTAIFYKDKSNTYDKIYCICKVSPKRVYNFAIEGIGRPYYDEVDSLYNKFMQTLIITY